MAVGWSTTGNVSPVSNNMKGAGWMTLAMAGYIVNDAFIKLVAEDLPLFQAIFIRGVIITALVMVLVKVRGEADRINRIADRQVLTRMVLEALATAAYLTALTKVPLASLSAVLQVVPVAVTFAAARLLKEPVSAVRVAAVGIGFAGVLLVIRPWSDAFSPWFLLGLVGVVLVVIRELVTRQVGQDVPSLVVALGTAIMITAMGLVVSVIQGWSEVTGRQIGLLATASVFLSVGYIGSIITVRIGDLSYSAPFRYTVLVFAIILQIVVFDDVPDGFTLLGAAIITAAGLWVIAADRQGPLRRQPEPHQAIGEPNGSR